MSTQAVATHCEWAAAADSLREHGRVRARVSGGSMLPVLRPGDLVELQCVSSSPAEPGDVVLVRQHGQLVVHRLLAANDNGLLTRGDALPHLDPAVGTDDVLARVVGLSRRGRSLAWRRSPHFGHRVGQWLFRRSRLAVRLYLHWQWLTSPFRR
jgi:signal peptidase I